MNRDEKLELLLKLERKKYMEILLAQEAFQKLFVDYYLKETLNEMIYREGSSPGVMVELNARKALNDFMFEVIDSGTEAEKQLKGN